MNEFEIKLPIELMEKVNKGYLKTIELISFILDSFPEVTTSKKIENTALKDINFNGKFPVNAWINEGKELLIIKF